MNPRIRPDDLLISPYKELIQTLVNQLIRAALPADGLTYLDYIRNISILLLTTQDPDRTTVIVQTLIAQASSLNKTAVWLEQELKFEGMIHGADRLDFLRLDLSQAGEVDDSALDLYNERVSRFSHLD
ncbi:hypothetical protein [Spirosoma validum]|uniref:Uncharacterized protein n=1 Tax=Spirosoma validum TaxID=2771355 RepID=A0A927B1Z5_9BACT|nr:hypothetical protein [Spirosoma validum]MBD2753899.1 hypothetical protein [Spirosoma validum]